MTTTSNTTQSSCPECGTPLGHCTLCGAPSLPAPSPPAAARPGTRPPAAPWPRWLMPLYGVAVSALLIRMGASMVSVFSGGSFGAVASSLWRCITVSLLLSVGFVAFAFVALERQDRARRRTALLARVDAMTGDEARALRLRLLQETPARGADRKIAAVMLARIDANLDGAAPASPTAS